MTCPEISSSKPPGLMDLNATTFIQASTNPPPNSQGKSKFTGTGELFTVIARSSSWIHKVFQWLLLGRLEVDK